MLYWGGILLALIFFVRHEVYQQRQITNLEYQVNFIQRELDKSSIEWDSENFNYLAIGNSITKHPINDYWWSECGMAASNPEKDFAHLIASAQNAQFYAYNFSAWELMSHDRGETLSLLDGMLSANLDLVTVQLGENVSNTTTFESDFEELISYIQRRAPKAQIIVIGDFWDEHEKDDYKKTACSATNVEFISLDGIKNLAEYQCGMGSIVYDDDGNEHVVEHSGVAKHPNDKAMKYIADKVIGVLKEQKD